MLEVRHLYDIKGEYAVGILFFYEDFGSIEILDRGGGSQ